MGFLLVASVLGSADGVAFFEAKVRPVLIQHCYGCHSEEARKAKKLRGGLLLDTRQGLREGGDSGPALVPGDSAKSLLVQSLRRDTKQMPPSGRLPASIIADLAKWIDLGAPDPRDGSVLPAKRAIDLEAGKKLWAFRPLAAVAPPKVKNEAWVRNPIDRFILAGLEKRGLSPAAPLPRGKLLRRLAFDVTGLPPEETEDDEAKIVRRLLASDRHGERWGRHWLDVARFAESGGYEFDGDRPGAHHYRDWVIKALNADMPFDEFVRMQLAGDEVKPDDLGTAAASGFLVAGPYPGQTTEKTLEPIRYDHLDDMLSTVGTGLLGLSIGCARCHEHKYDPIPQEDYYRLLATLSRTDSVRRKIDPDPDETRRRKAAFDAAHVPIVAARQRFIEEKLPAKLEAWLKTPRPAAPWLALDPPAKGAKALVVRTAMAGWKAVRVEPAGEASVTVSGPKGKPAAVKLKPAGKGVFVAEKPFGPEGGSLLTITTKPPGAKVSITREEAKAEEASSPWFQAEIAARAAAKDMPGVLELFRRVDAEAEKAVAAVEASLAKEPKPALADVFTAASGRGGDVHYLIRGETDKKNGVARPGFARVLTEGEAGRWLRNGKDALPPRVALGKWITDPKGGAGHLLARVIVNRLWQHHFGKGLVRTPNDFGAQGEPPTHPELLDWLAGELIRGGWRLRPLHELMVTSAAYRQSGAASPLAQKEDPRNLLWSHVPPRRLEAEAIRDALLSVGGTLDLNMFGPGTLDDRSPRRSVYLTVKRTRLSPFLQAFDAPESIQSVGERQSTTTTTQALALLNSPFVRSQAGKLAKRAGSVEKAYRLALGRPPSAAEAKRLARIALADACH
ncbi:MAG: PSD1 and planctomycete cytochrome C domain-containing protein, partial [Gemmataceae bacterium]|nr:PSD1 and planctomycete cytochrome C domain-containing protein [Gemmataceae bacterium]